MPSTREQIIQVLGDLSGDNDLRMRDLMMLTGRSRVSVHKELQNLMDDGLVARRWARWKSGAICGRTGGWFYRLKKKKKE
jgi:predicted transcriptional regulator